MEAGRNATVLRQEKTILSETPEFQSAKKSEVSQETFGVLTHQKINSNLAAEWLQYSHKIGIRPVCVHRKEDTQHHWIFTSHTMGYWQPPLPNKTSESTVAGWWYTYPSEKWWSSSVGMMKFPTEWKVIKFHGCKPPGWNGPPPVFPMFSVVYSHEMSWNSTLPSTDFSPTSGTCWRHKSISSWEIWQTCLVKTGRVKRSLRFALRFNWNWRDTPVSLWNQGCFGKEELLGFVTKKWRNHQLESMDRVDLEWFLHWNRISGWR